MFALIRTGPRSFLHLFSGSINSMKSPRRFGSLPRSPSGELHAFSTSTVERLINRSIICRHLISSLILLHSLHHPNPSPPLRVATVSQGECWGWRCGSVFSITDSICIQSIRKIPPLFLTASAADNPLNRLVASGILRDYISRTGKRSDKCRSPCSGALRQLVPPSGCKYSELDFHSRLI